MKIIELFEKYIGTKEYDGIVAIIQKWYWGSLVKEAWCATSESYFAKEAGILDKLGGKNCGVWEMGEACKKLHKGDGTFFEYPNLPDIKKHDIIFLERKGASHVTNAYEDKKYSDSTATVKCLGGNQNDMICVKAYAMNKIQYIYRPYAEVEPTGERPVIGQGYNDSLNGGSWCKTLQEKLSALGYKNPDGSDLAIDGSCGGKTVHAIKCIQAANRILSIDGVCGPQTWSVIDVLTKAGTFKVTVTTDLYVRNAPNGGIKGTISAGDNFTVTAIEGKWFYLAEVQGWASSVFLKMT